MQNKAEQERRMAIGEQLLANVHNSVDILSPYSNGYVFSVEGLSCFDDKTFCLRLKPSAAYIKYKRIMTKTFALYQDFFNIGIMFDQDTTCEKSGDKIIVHDSWGKTCKIEPIKDEPFEADVVWDENLGYLNLLNPKLVDWGLVRTICGRTYYPLNLFKIKNMNEARESDFLTLFRDYCKPHSRVATTYTLYYYIEDDYLCVGKWIYEKFMPYDPIKVKPFGLKEFLKTHLTNVK